MPPPFIRLTRPEIAEFASDSRTIREIEKLVDAVNTLNNAAATMLGAEGETAMAAAGEAIGLALQAARDGAINAGTADAKATQALASLDRLSDAVELLALAPAQSGGNDYGRSGRYGAFHDSTTQTAAVANTAYPIVLGATDLSLGVYLGAPTSRVYVDTGGIYNIQFSAQLDRTLSTDGIIWIWLRINGANVSNSASQIRLKGNDAETIAAWNFLVSLNAGNYFEIVWAADDTASRLQAIAAAGVVPAIPSMILTVDNIST
jgi:hypothetical protein